MSGYYSDFVWAFQLFNLLNDNMPTILIFRSRCLLQLTALTSPLPR